MMDAKTDLLTTLLQCGIKDIDVLIDILDMGNELFDDNILADVIDEYGSESFCEFNKLMYHLMESITYNLVREMEDGEECERILSEKWDGPYTNYMDSYFQIDCLDAWKPGTDKDKLLKDLKKDIFAMR